MPCQASWYCGITNKTIKNRDFIFKTCFGLVPRWYEHNNPKEKFICKEEQEVKEILFIQTGQIGIGFSRLTFDDTEPFKEMYTFGNNQIVGDHYVMNKVRSNFIYVAKTDIHGFALKSNYIKN